MKKANNPPVFLERCPTTKFLEQHSEIFQKETQKWSSKLECFSNHGTNVNHDMKSTITIDSPEGTNISQKAIKLELLQDQLYNDTNGFNHQLNIISPCTEFEAIDVDEDGSNPNKRVKSAAENAISYFFDNSFDRIWTPECNSQEPVINAKICNLECMQQQQLKNLCNTNEINASSEFAIQSVVGLESAREMKIERDEIRDSYNGTHLAYTSSTKTERSDDDLKGKAVNFENSRNKMEARESLVSHNRDGNDGYYEVNTNIHSKENFDDTIMDIKRENIASNVYDIMISSKNLGIQKDAMNLSSTPEVSILKQELDGVDNFRINETTTNWEKNEYNIGCNVCPVMKAENVNFPSKAIQGDELLLNGQDLKAEAEFLLKEEDNTGYTWGNEYEIGFQEYSSNISLGMKPDIFKTESSEIFFSDNEKYEMALRSEDYSSKKHLSNTCKDSKPGTACIETSNPKLPPLVIRKDLFSNVNDDYENFANCNEPQKISGSSEFPEKRFKMVGKITTVKKDKKPIILKQALDLAPCKKACPCSKSSTNVSRLANQDVPIKVQETIRKWKIQFFETSPKLENEKNIQQLIDHYRGLVIDQVNETPTSDHDKLKEENLKKISVKKYYSRFYALGCMKCKMGFEFKECFKRHHENYVLRMYKHMIHRHYKKQMNLKGVKNVANDDLFQCGAGDCMYRAKDAMALIDHTATWHDTFDFFFRGEDIIVFPSIEIYDIWEEENLKKSHLINTLTEEDIIERDKQKIEGARRDNLLIEIAHQQGAETKRRLILELFDVEEKQLKRRKMEKGCRVILSSNEPCGWYSTDGGAIEDHYITNHPEINFQFCPALFYKHD